MNFTYSSNTSCKVWLITQNWSKYSSYHQGKDVCLYNSRNVLSVIIKTYVFLIVFLFLKKTPKVFEI